MVSKLFRSLTTVGRDHLNIHKNKRISLSYIYRKEVVIILRYLTSYVIACYQRNRETVLTIIMLRIIRKSKTKLIKSYIIILNNLSIE